MQLLKVEILVWFFKSPDDMALILIIKPKHIIICSEF